jgi:hypothetical protein
MKEAAEKSGCPSGFNLIVNLLRRAGWLYYVSTT